MIYDQQEFDVKLEWGIRGVETLLPVSDVVVIVDVLSFSTCVDIAIGNGAMVYPYRWKDESAVAYALSLGAELADVKRKYTGGYSLSPRSMTSLRAGMKLVLPSPNGATLTLATGSTPTLCGCLRNARAVAEFAMQLGSRITVIAAGERWPDDSMRPAFEDVLGAGAIISHLRGTLSPESKVALSAFDVLQANLAEEIRNCISGRELIERGFEEDLHLACDLNVSGNVPVLRDRAYRSS